MHHPREFHGKPTVDIRNTAGNLIGADFLSSTDRENTAVNKNFSAVILDTA